MAKSTRKHVRVTRQTALAPRAVVVDFLKAKHKKFGLPADIPEVLHVERDKELIMKLVRASMEGFEFHKIPSERETAHKPKRGKARRAANVVSLSKYRKEREAVSYESMSVERINEIYMKLRNAEYVQDDHGRAS